MALINCPDCNTSVSDKADRCPKCSCPISLDNSKNVKIIEKNSEGCFLQTLNIGCVVFLILFALIIILPLLVATFN